MIRLWILTLFISMPLVGSIEASDFTFSKSIAKKHKVLIQDDLEYLKQIVFFNTTQKSRSVFELNHLDGYTIYQWLNKRVSYFVDESILSKTNVNFFESLYRTKPNGSYPHPTILPSSEAPQFDFIFSAKDEFIMSNLGAALYLKGKQEERTYHAKLNPKSISNKGELAVESPRIGLLMIGSGFFGNHVTINKKDLSLKANRISRLSILAHEARHSDGNTQSLSFGHALCPKDHYLSKRAACDDNSNGPYTLGAQLALEMLKVEATINITEKEALKIIILDNLSRSLSPTHWDTKPESLQR